MEETTIVLTHQQKELILDLLKHHAKDASTTNTDKFIVHEIINKITQDEI